MKIKLVQIITTLLTMGSLANTANAWNICAKNWMNDNDWAQARTVFVETVKQDIIRRLEYQNIEVLSIKESGRSLYLTTKDGTEMFIGFIPVELFETTVGRADSEGNVQYCSAKADNAFIDDLINLNSKIVVIEGHHLGNVELLRYQPMPLP